MTKSQLIERIAQKVPHLPPERVALAVNTLFEQMAQALREGERIELRGFGCFVGKPRRARLARNPKTGAPVALRQRVALLFSAGKELRERLNRIPPPRQAEYLPASDPEVLPPAAQPSSDAECAPRI